VTDSRGHGKSGLGTDHLTYVQMMEDYNALLEQLGVNVVRTAQSGAEAIKSLAQFPYKKMLFELGNSIRYANNEYSGVDGDNGFSMWEIGLNAKLPVSWNIQNRPNDLNLFAVYSGFMNELELTSALDDTVTISRLYKVGVALNAASNFSILGIKFRGGGLTFTYGDGFAGIGLTTGFPF